MFAVVVGLVTSFVVELLVVRLDVFWVVILGLVSGAVVVVAKFAVVGPADNGLVLVGLAVVWLRHNFLSTFELSKSLLVC